MSLMQSTRSRFISTATLAAMSLVLAGCSSTATGRAAPSESGDGFTPEQGYFAESGEPELETMTAPLFSASAFALPAWVAADRGIWDAYGLDVETPLVASTQVIPLYLSGDTNFAALGGYTAMPIQATGSPVSVYGWFLAKHSYTLFAQDDVKSVEDLEGQTIGISQPGGLPHLAALAVLEEHGLDPAKVTFQPLNNVGNVYSALSTGQITAGAFGTPYAVLAKNEGLNPLFDMKTEDLAGPGVAYIGNPEWMEKNPNTAKAYLQGWLEAEAVILTEPDYAKELLAKNLELDPVAEADVIEAGYAELISVITRPGVEAAETSPDLKKAMVTAMELSGETPKGSPDDLEPDWDIFAELNDDGFFRYLEEKYGDF